LSGNMKEALPWLIALSSSQPIEEISEAARRGLRRYFERFGLLVDVCTSNEQIPEKRKKALEHRLNDASRQREPAVLFQSRQAWLNEQPNDQVKVYIGRHLGVLGCFVDMNVAHGGILDRGAGKFMNTKRITFVAKELAVCIDINMPDTPIPDSFHDLRTLSAWPPPTPVSYFDYFSLRNHDESTLAILRAVSSPAGVQKLERDWRARRDGLGGASGGQRD
jgi:hypothetical protein